MYRLLCFGLFCVAVMGLAGQPTVMAEKPEVAAGKVSLISLRVHELQSEDDIRGVTDVLEKVAGVQEVALDKKMDSTVYFKVKVAAGGCICTELSKAVGDKKLQVVDPVHVVSEFTLCKRCHQSSPPDAKAATRINEAFEALKGAVQVSSTAGQSSVIVHQTQDTVDLNGLTATAKKIPCCCCPLAFTLQSHEVIEIDLVEKGEVNLAQVKSEMESVYGVAKVAIEKDSLHVTAEKGKVSRETLEGMI